MIKRILTFMVLALSISASSFAQDSKEPPTLLVRTPGSGFTYEKVVDVPSVPKDELYKKVKKWVVGNLKTVDNNIALDDPDKSTISTSTVLVMEKRKWMVHPPALTFKISFSFKDNKMKVNAGQFILHYEEWFSPFDDIKIASYNKGDKQIAYEYFDKIFGAMIESLQAAANKKDDNW